MAAGRRYEDAERREDGRVVRTVPYSEGMSAIQEKEAEGREV